MNLYLSAVRQTIKAFPAVVPHLKGRARWIASAFGGVPVVEWGVLNPDSIGIMKPTDKIYNVRLGYKTVDFFQSTLERMVRNVYSGDLGGEFIDIMANLISGQLTQAYEQAWEDEGTEGELPTYLLTSLEDMILGQYDFVDTYYRAIVDAKVDDTPIDPLLSRAADWAHQWDVAYKQAVQLIRLDSGGNLQWVKGETEKGCNTCASLDGIIMSAKEWEELDVHPRGYPNNKLECGGGGPVNNCDCELVPTEQRRSPRAYDTVLNIVSR